MYNIQCTDNNQGKGITQCFNGNWEDEQKNILPFFEQIANKKLNVLLHSDETPDLLVFPDSFLAKDDDIGQSQIIGFHNETITTHNLMGFIGKGDVSLTIKSRFDNNKSNSNYFLQYMLQKVFAINLVDLETTVDNENIWRFLLFYIFPYYLNKALKQGVFKQYVRKQYNDSNVKGSVDVARHIRQNIPFMGNVAYNTREYSYDNSVTQLIRHAIEFIKSTRFRNALSQSRQTIDNVRLLQQLTPDYSSRDRQKVILQNLQAVNHPYFTKYEPLRKICLQILKYQGVALRKSNKRVFGLLFDGAWLWEEYLNVVLKQNNLGFNHPENKEETGGVQLFQKGEKLIYPDFYKNGQIVIDAKYKHLERGNSEQTTGDYYQVITYMYRLKAATGILLYPKEDNNAQEKSLMHKDSYGTTDARFIKYGMKISQDKENFESFRNEISKSEEDLTQYLSPLSK